MRMPGPGEESGTAGEDVQPHVARVGAVSEDGVHERLAVVCREALQVRAEDHGREVLLRVRRFHAPGLQPGPDVRETGALEAGGRLGGRREVPRAGPAFQRGMADRIYRALDVGHVARAAAL